MQRSSSTDTLYIDLPSVAWNMKTWSIVDAVRSYEVRNGRFLNIPQPCAYWIAHG